jgi:hypothetical protein
VHAAVVEVAEKVRGGFEVDHELGQLAAHALARAQEEGHAFPAPVVDHQLERSVGVAGRIRAERRALRG